MDLVERQLDDDKAQDVIVINLIGKTSLADYMVIATGGSQRHLGAMSMHLREKLKKLGIPSIPTEGEQQGDWVLLDAGDVLIHLFRSEVRSFYNLEKMWGLELPTPQAAAGAGAAL
nr:ribosome silencing factor [Magnetospira sp. QH-2]